MEPLAEKTYEIAKFREWRFEVGFGTTVEVKVSLPSPRVKREEGKGIDN